MQTQLLQVYRKEDLASVHVLSLGPGTRRTPLLVEVVESVQPPIPRDRKWVVIVSTFAGCPVGCLMCDAAGKPGVPLGAEEILAQVEHVVRDRYPLGHLPQEKLKIQFARMGEPSLNPQVLTALRELPRRIRASGLLPSVSTVAPRGCWRFFEKLAQIKNSLYRPGSFQLQLSVHSTDQAARRHLIPIRTLDLSQMAKLGQHFHEHGDRKITLNFAASNEHPIEPGILAKYFDPDLFLVKLTPLNPTQSVRRSGLTSLLSARQPSSSAHLAAALESRGFQVIVSIGELEENQVGSNCGQFVTKLVNGRPSVREGYSSGCYALGREQPAVCPSPPSEEGPD